MFQEAVQRPLSHVVPCRCLLDGKQYWIDRFRLTASSQIGDQPNPPNR